MNRLTKANGLRKEAAPINDRVFDVSLTVDDHRLSIVIHIPVATLPDHAHVVTIPVVTLPDNIAIAVTIAIAVMAGSDGYASRTDTHTNFFCAGRHGGANSDRCDSDHCKTLDHFVFLKSMNYQGANPGSLEWFQHDDRTAVMISPRHRKPDHDGDERDDNPAPYHWRSPFRAPASRGIVGGLIEVAVHWTPLVGVSSESIVGQPIETPSEPCPKAL
jgi:hypothetical protein